MINLNHIALIVSSEDKLEFYKKFGFEETKRFQRKYDTVVFLEVSNITLEIFVDPKHPERLSDPETKGLRHIAFSVDNLDDIVEIIDCEEIRTDWFGKRFTFTRDLDGQPIELKER